MSEQLMLETQSYLLAFTVAISCVTVPGAINGLLVIRFRLSPLITTLATSSIYRGRAIHMPGAQSIPVSREKGFLGNGRLFGLPVPIIFLAGVYLLNHTRLGVYCCVMGSSARSARESNLPSASVTVLVYAMGGFVAGVAALILLARVGGLQSGIGIEFTVIADRVSARRQEQVLLAMRSSKTGG